MDKFRHCVRVLCWAKVFVANNWLGWAWPPTFLCCAVFPSTNLLRCWTPTTISVHVKDILWIREKATIRSPLLFTENIFGGILRWNTKHHQNRLSPNGITTYPYFCTHQALPHTPFTVFTLANPNVKWNANQANVMDFCHHLYILYHSSWFINDHINSRRIQLTEICF